MKTKLAKLEKCAEQIDSQLRLMIDLMNKKRKDKADANKAYYDNQSRSA